MPSRVEELPHAEFLLVPWPRMARWDHCQTIGRVHVTMLWDRTSSFQFSTFFYRGDIKMNLNKAKFLQVPRIITKASIYVQ